MNINTQINLSFKVLLKIDDVKTWSISLRAIFVPKVAGSKANLERQRKRYLPLRDGEVPNISGSFNEQVRPGLFHHHVWSIVLVDLEILDHKLA